MDNLGTQKSAGFSIQSLLTHTTGGSHVCFACVFSASEHTTQAVISNRYHTAPPLESSRTAPLPSHFDGLL